MKLTSEGHENILWRVADLGLSLKEFATRLGYNSVPEWLADKEMPTDHFRFIDRNPESLRNALHCGPCINVNANDFQTACLAIDAVEEARKMLVQTEWKSATEARCRLAALERNRRSMRKGILLNYVAAFLVGFVSATIWFGLTAPINREITPARAAALGAPIVTPPAVMPTPIRSGEHARELLNPIMLTPEAVAPERIK